jgi:hypothetical protein
MRSRAVEVRTTRCPRMVHPVPVLNWLVRYAPVAADVEIATSSVLDVGSGSVGLSCVFPQARFAGQDLGFSAPVPGQMFAVRTDPGRFPWVDGAFDTVVCLDVLEHVPGHERSRFVRECARVAARRILLSCPTESGLDADEFLLQMYRSSGEEPPSWLGEHLELGLPTIAELEAACEVPGFRHNRWPQVNGLLAGLIVVGDFHPLYRADAATEYQSRHFDWIAALQACRFGDGIRQGIELERIDAGEPIVDPLRFDRTIAAALECPVCRGLLRLDESTTLWCSSCGRTAALDQTGAYDLRVDALTSPRERSRIRNWFRRRARPRR